MPLPQGLQDFESVAAREHQVQHNQVEHLGIGAEEPVFAGRGDHDIVVLGLQRRCEDVRQFSFVFDDQHPH